MPFYPTHADLLRDLVDIVRDEVRWLVSEGVRYIQFDAPYYSHYLDPQQRERLRAAGFDPDQELERAIAGDNAALQEVPRGKVTVALHICRGNSRSRWYTEGGYEAIAEKLFGLMDVDAFLLEYDSANAPAVSNRCAWCRATKPWCWAWLPPKKPSSNRKTNCGGASMKRPAMFRIENLALSPQCGFASVAAGNLLSMDDQWRKLELVVETRAQGLGQARSYGWPSVRRRPSSDTRRFPFPKSRLRGSPSSTAR